LGTAPWELSSGRTFASQALAQSNKYIAIHSANAKNYIAWRLPQQQSFAHIPLQAGDGTSNETTLHVQGSKVTLSVSQADFIASQEAVFAPTAAAAGEHRSQHFCDGAQQFHIQRGQARQQRPLTCR
jgi:hypothetical protein